jgi:hypothetical protein
MFQKGIILICLLNRIDEALDEYKKSLELRIKQLGENDLQVAQSYDRFGDIYVKQSK